VAACPQTPQGTPHIAGQGAFYPDDGLRGRVQEGKARGMQAGPLQ